MSGPLLAIFWAIIYTVCVLSIGAAVMLAARRQNAAAGQRSLGLFSESLALGCGVLPWLLLMFSMRGWLPTREVVLSLGGVGLICSGLLNWMGPRRVHDAQPSRGSIALLILPGLMLLGSATIQLSAAILPAVDIDAVADWGFKAKQLYMTPLWPRPAYLHDLTLSYSHLDYPLLMPMLWAGLYALFGAINDGPGKLALLLPILAIATLLYSELQPRLGRIAWLCIALAIGAPMMNRWAPMGLADAPLSMFVLSTSIFLLRWIERFRWTDAALAGCCAAFAAQTKLEGQATFAAAGLPLLLITAMNIRSRWKGLLAFIGFGVTLDLPWLLWSRGLPHTFENYAGRLSPNGVVSHLPRLVEVATRVYQTFDLKYWGMLLLIVLAAAGLSWRTFRQREVISIWLMLLILLGCDGLAYLITPWDLTDLVPMSLDRLLVQLLPLTVLIIGLHLENLLREKAAEVDILLGDNAARCS